MGIFRSIVEKLKEIEERAMSREEALQYFFEYIKRNYPDKEFQHKDMPGVPRAFLKEMERQTAGTYWIDSNPEIFAAETLLMALCHQGLLKRRDVERNVYGDQDIFFSLTPKWKQDKSSLWLTVKGVNENATK